MIDVMAIKFFLCLFFGLSLLLLFKAASRRTWMLFLGLSVVMYIILSNATLNQIAMLIVIYGVITLFFGVKRVRENTISRFLFQREKRKFNKKEALELQSFAPVFETLSPYFKMLNAVEKNDVAAFDSACFDRLDQNVSHYFSTIALSLSQGYFSNPPYSSLKRYYQRYDQASFAFSLLLDFSLSAVLSWPARRDLLNKLDEILQLIYLGLGLLDYAKVEDLPMNRLSILEWLAQANLFDIQNRMGVVIDLFPNKCRRIGYKAMIFPYGKRITPPSDLWGIVIWMREKLLEEFFTTRGLSGAGLFEKYVNEFEQLLKAMKRVDDAKEKGELSGEEWVQQVTAAIALGLLTQREADALLSLEQLKNNWQHK